MGCGAGAWAEAQTNPRAALYVARVGRGHGPGGGAGVWDEGRRGAGYGMGRMGGMFVRGVASGGEGECGGMRGNGG